MWASALVIWDWSRRGARCGGVDASVPNGVERLEAEATRVHLPWTSTRVSRLVPGSRRRVMVRFDALALKSNVMFGYICRYIYIYSN